MIDGFPVELKLEKRKTFTITQIVDSYKKQAADYVARFKAPFGFLVVGDIADRDTPIPLANQDIQVVEVETSSGDSVVVVAIIVRLAPRSPSSYSK